MESLGMYVEWDNGSFKHRRFRCKGNGRGNIWNGLSEWQQWFIDTWPSKNPAPLAPLYNVRTTSGLAVRNCQKVMATGLSLSSLSSLLYTWFLPPPPSIILDMHFGFPSCWRYRSSRGPCNPGGSCRTEEWFPMELSKEFRSRNIFLKAVDICSTSLQALSLLLLPHPRRSLGPPPLPTRRGHCSVHECVSLRPKQDHHRPHQSWCAPAFHRQSAPTPHGHFRDGRQRTFGNEPWFHL